MTKNHYAKQREGCAVVPVKTLSSEDPDDSCCCSGKNSGERDMSCGGEQRQDPVHIKGAITFSLAATKSLKGFELVPDII